MVRTVRRDRGQNTQGWVTADYVLDLTEPPNWYLICLIWILNPVDYSVWGALWQLVYREDIGRLKEFLNICWDVIGQLRTNQRCYGPVVQTTDVGYRPIVLMMGTLRITSINSYVMTAAIFPSYCPVSSTGNLTLVKYPWDPDFPYWTGVKPDLFKLIGSMNTHDRLHICGFSSRRPQSFAKYFVVHLRWTEELYSEALTAPAACTQTT